MSAESRHKNYLFTGPPGCGKSTVIEKLVQRLDTPHTGFYTKEIREMGRRVGFSITTLDGRRRIMAHTGIPGRHRVSRYGVDLEAIDRLAVTSMIPANERMIVVVDEIGKMECISSLFRKTLIKILDSENTVIGSIALKADAFIGEIKKRPDTEVILVSEKNRDILPRSYSALLSAK